MNKYHFFLGGKDAEMVRVKQILDESELDYTDGELGWGAKVSDYGDQINQVAQLGKTPVILELEKDTDLAEGVVDLDHHGERAQEDAVIEQVSNLIGREMTRFDKLIAANDRGYIPAMQEMGATQEEIDEVRAFDRECQGITAEQEAEAERAIAALEEGPNDLKIIQMEHSKSSTVTDRLFGSQERENILILSGDGEVNYYGSGDLCTELKEKFPDGWAGGQGLGNKEENAFFGGYPNHEEVRGIIEHRNLRMENRNNDAQALGNDIQEKVVSTPSLLDE